MFVYLLIINMAAALIGSLYQFNIEQQNWAEYTEIMEHYFAANKITDDTMKVNVLCSNVGPRTYHIMKDLCLPDTPDDKTFDELKELLKVYYKPKMSETSASLIFNSRNRKDGETVQVFVASLRRLAVPCNYGPYLDRALKDRFIAGINDKDIQEKILNVPDSELTFQKAYSIAQSHEAACRNVKEMQQSALGSRSTQDSINKIQQKNYYKPGRSTYSRTGRGPPQGHSGRSEAHKPEVRSHKPEFAGRKPDSRGRKFEAGKECFRCGGNHDPDMCWAKTRKCFTCGKTGHAKVKCWKNKSHTRMRYVCDNSTEYSEESCDNYEEEVAVHTMYNIRGNKVPPMLVDLEIKGQNVTFEVDTGSPYSILAENTVKKLFDTYELKHPKLNIKSFTGHKVNVLGEFAVPVKHKDHTSSATFLVTTEEPNLVGRDLIDVFGLVTMNYVSDSNALEEILKKHSNLFKHELGKLKGVQAKIHVNADATPIFHKARPLPYAMRTGLKRN